MHLEYKIYWVKKVDGMNIASVTSKFFLDLLQEMKIIKDDNIELITESYSN